MDSDHDDGEAPAGTGKPAPGRYEQKAKWPPGPWHDEPDRLEFEHAGFPCIVQRGPLGAWCGYVGVDKTHPWFGAHYDDCCIREKWDLEVHGGLTYASPCQGEICHVGEPDDDRHWLGFDCGHLGDLVPAMLALRAEVAELRGVEHRMRETYRDLAYVRRETEHLAEQAAEAARARL